MFLTYFSLATLIAVLALSWELFRGERRLERLDALAPDTSATPPRVSIVVAARNEEKNIHDGVLSLLQLDYPNLELIVVDDRSTDRTAEILAELARAHSTLWIATVTDLPSGWLGKNNALRVGAALASGDYILFTDADVVMDPSVLRRAIGYAARRRLDHLAIGPASEMPGVWLNLFMVGFLIFFNAFTRPWRVRDPKSRAHIGIGAFNLVRRSVYAALGGHAPLALRPDDDLKLGKLFKKNGYRCDFLIGAPLIRVEWYATVAQLVRGLEKNAFAGCDYRLSVVIVGMIAQAWIFIWPFLAVWLATGVARAALIATIALLFLIAARAARTQRQSAWYALGLPLASMMFIFIVVRSTCLNLRQRGIYWRGTFYPLDELKKNTV
jgi:cellulose synthase/poly-beta-1,6-N-acetylglucosamine synthase-like glycosyltransferase